MPGVGRCAGDPGLWGHEARSCPVRGLCPPWLTARPSPRQRDAGTAGGSGHGGFFPRETGWRACSRCYTRCVPLYPITPPLPAVAHPPPFTVQLRVEKVEEFLDELHAKSRSRTITVGLLRPLPASPPSTFGSALLSGPHVQAVSAVDAWGLGPAERAAVAVGSVPASNPGQ